MGKVGTPRYKSEIGNVYGKLTVVEFVKTNKQTSFWRCVCECGEETVTRGNGLRSGVCKSCGKCDVQRAMPDDAPFKRSWRSLQQQAKQAERVLELSYDSFLDKVTQNCSYCGQEPYDKHYAYSRRRWSRGIEYDKFCIFNGIDRIDSNKGYTLDNINACCNMCNRMKTDFDLAVFLNHVRKINEHNAKTSFHQTNC